MKNPREANFIIIHQSSIIIIQTLRATAYTYQSNPPILNRSNHARFQNPIQRILRKIQPILRVPPRRSHRPKLRHPWQRPPPHPRPPSHSFLPFRRDRLLRHRRWRYDVAWSKSHDSLLVAAIADDSLKIYDLSLPPTSNPIRSLHEHTHEVQSVDYNPVRRDSFISSSWDDSIKLWTLDRPTSIRSFQEHAYCVYAAVWNPRHADVFASASGDCTLRVWDVREPGSTMVVAAHEFEILSCNWNKYDDCVIATASVDKSVRVWDISF